MNEEVKNIKGTNVTKDTKDIKKNNIPKDIKNIKSNNTIKNNDDVKDVKNTLFNWIIRSLLLILIIIVSFCIFNYLKPKTTKVKSPSMVNTILKLNSTNKDLSTSIYTKDNSINLKEINICLDKLTLLKEDAEVIFKDNADINPHFLNGIHNNILFYQQIKILLDHSNSIDFNETLKLVENYKKVTIEEYSNCNFEHSKDIFPSQSIKYINEAYLSFNKTIKEKRDIDIKTNDNLKFKASLSSMVENFLYLKVDKFSLIEKCREGKYTYEILENDIEKDFKSFEDIKTEFNSMKIPPNAIETYQAFGEVLNSYNVYLKELKRSVSNEKSVFNSDTDKGVLDIVDEDIRGKYEDIEMCLQKFNTTFAHFSDEIKPNK